jgi:hypothetical protein
VPDDESMVYAVGSFQKAGLADRWGAAAFEAATGDELGWMPTAGNVPQSVRGAVVDGSLYLGSLLAATPDGRPSYAQYSVAPVNGAPPALGGPPTAGAAVTCTPGAWRNGPDVTVAWLIDGAPVGGATGRSFTPAAADVGKALACRETGANPAGSASATSPAATVVVASPGGGGTSGDGEQKAPPSGDPTAPAKLTLAASLGKHTRTKIVLRLTLSAAAKTTATLRTRAKHPRRVRRASGSRPAGKSTLVLRPRKHHRFAAGRYRVTVTARDAQGHAAKKVVLAVRLKRR